MTRLLIVTIALSLSVLATDVAAQDDEAYIGYRQMLMEGIGKDMGAISDILKYGLPLTGSIAGHARSMAALAEIVAPAFGHRVSEGRTDAKPSIWEDAAGFATATTNFVEATKQLVEVAGSGDAAAIGVQLKAVGKACGGCHEDFRKPKEESFKRENDGDSDSH